MITCTGCGKKNADEALYCAACGKKIQSARQPVPSAGPSDAPLTRFRHQGVSPDVWRSIKRMVEAWCYVMLLLGVAGLCWQFKVYWPLYPTVGLLAVFAWFRRI